MYLLIHMASLLGRSLGFLRARCSRFQYEARVLRYPRRLIGSTTVNVPLVDLNQVDDFI